MPNNDTAEEKAYFSGRNAFIEHRAEGEKRNPYPYDSPLHDIWLNGFWEEANKGTINED